MNNSSTERRLNRYSVGNVPWLEEAFVVTDSLLKGLNYYFLARETFYYGRTTGCVCLIGGSTSYNIDHL